MEYLLQLGAVMIHQLIVPNFNLRLEVHALARTSINSEAMIIFKLDKIWCGKTQLPAFQLEKLTADIFKSQKLALFRIFTAFLLFCEILGYFFITLGLTQNAPLQFFIFGILLKIGGGLTSSILQNKSGALLSMELYAYLKTVKAYFQEVSTNLGNKGCSEAEIQGLSILPSELYHCEINNYQRARLLNLGTPVACGIALLLSGEIISAIVIIALGFLAFPIGEYFFKVYTFRHESKLRLGRSAQLLEFIKQVYDEHVLQTFQINLLSQVPLLFFLLRFFWNSGNLLSIFFGFTQGLIGLSGTLAFQRSRINSLRTVQTANHLIDALSSDDFIITPKRWSIHCKKEKTEVSFSEMNGDGVALVNFTVAIPSRAIQSFSPIDCKIPAGSCCIIQAPSGYGKSTFILSLMHMLEHTGDLYFIQDGCAVNAHDMPLNNLQEKMYFCREENIDKSSRLVDLFQEVVIKDLHILYSSMKAKFGDSMTTLAWEAADNLVEQEISFIQKGMQSVFTKELLPYLIQMRQQRIGLVNGYLKDAGGSLKGSQIHSERGYISLSAGEKRRVMSLLAFETARIKPDLQLIILDEPLAHLDHNGIHDQMEIFKKIQTLNSSPSILIIAHHFIEELSKNLDKTFLVKF